MATTEFSYNQSYKQKGSRFATLFVLGRRGIRGVRGATIGVIGIIGVIGFALSYISYTSYISYQTRKIANGQWPMAKSQKKIVN